MESNVAQVFEALLGQLKNMAKTETVIGEPFTIGEYHAVPVIKIFLGMGAGMGTGPALGKKSESSGQAPGGGGGGGGIRIEPIGFLVSRGDHVSLLTLGKKGALTSLLDRVPDLMEKGMDKFAEKKKERAEKKKEEK
jgi:uncharacterized spore protein YtfJ